MAKKAWQFWQPVLFVLLLLVWTAASVIGSQLIVGYPMSWILGGETLSQPVWSGIFSVLSYTLAIWLVVSVFPKLLGIKKSSERKRNKSKQAKRVAALTNREDLGLRELPTWTDIGLAPVGYIIYLVLAAGLTALFSLFPWFDAGQAQEVGFDIYIAGVDRVIAFLTLVVLAPIAEEVIFRGWLYGKLREVTSERFSHALSIVISAFLVSLLFGIVHLQWNVGVNVFALSLVLCGLREITGTIYAGILLHMLKNCLAFYLLYVMGL